MSLNSARVHATSKSKNIVQPNSCTHVEQTINIKSHLRCKCKKTLKDYTSHGLCASKVLLKSYTTMTKWHTFLIYEHKGRWWDGSEELDGHISKGKRDSYYSSNDHQKRKNWPLMISLSFHTVAYTNPGVDCLGWTCPHPHSRFGV